MATFRGPFSCRSILLFSVRYAFDTTLYASGAPRVRTDAQGKLQNFEHRTNLKTGFRLPVRCSRPARGGLQSMRPVRRT